MEKRVTKQISMAFCLLIAGLIAITSCNDSSIIGSDIIGSDQLNVKVIELDIKATTIKGDSIQTYRATDQLNRYLCGNMKDPLFGEFEAAFNTQLRLSRFLNLGDSIAIEQIGLGNATLDSAFLVLEIDSFYGELSNEQLVEVRLLDEPLSNTEVYYSSKEFMANDILGSKKFNPANPDKVVFYVGGEGELPDTITPPQMRIPLDIDHPIFKDVLFGGENSLQYFQDDAALLEVFNGVQVKVSNGFYDGMNVFDPIPASPSTPSVTGLYVHYTSNLNNEPILFTFGINENTAKMVSFNPDYSETAVEPFIGENKYENGDSLFFIQGMSGLNAKLEIQNLSALEDVIINKAEIEFTVASDLLGDEAIFSQNPIPQLLIATKNSDGDLENIRDVEAAIAGGLIAIFGGNVEEVSNGSSTPMFKYKMNITAYIQELANGLQDNAEIFVYPAIQAERAHRVAIFGPGHSQHPVKLYVTYTENQ